MIAGTSLRALNAPERCTPSAAQLLYPRWFPLGRWKKVSGVCARGRSRTFLMLEGTSKEHERAKVAGLGDGAHGESIMVQKHGVRATASSIRRGLSVRLRTALITATTLALLCAGGTPAEAQSVREDFYVTNGSVNTAVLSGNTLYIAGGFTQVGPATGGGVPIDAMSGVPVAGFPKVTGHVYAVEPDGSGGWYVGGRFTNVGGVPRNNIAHILSDNSVSAWNPDPDNEASHSFHPAAVNTIAVSGNTVYVGGSFTNIGGEERTAIAALDATTGLATAWNPRASRGRTVVYRFLVNGPTV